MPVNWQIKCKGAGFWSDADADADAHMLEAECVGADYSEHAGGDFDLITIFSAQLDAPRRVRQCYAQMLAVLEILVQGFISTILTPMLLLYHFRRRPCARCLVSYNEFSAPQIYMSRCYTSSHLQAAVHDVLAIFTPLGLIHRRRVRASSLSFLRFCGEDISVLSLVIHTFDLQLNLHLGCVCQQDCWLSR
jgi:hypothetical protein